MRFILFFLLSGAAHAQLDRPVLEGKCGGIIVTIRNDLIRAEKISGKRVCTFRAVDGALSERRGESVTLYLAPMNCDGKLHGDQDFALREVSKSPFLEIKRLGKYGEGVFTVYAEKKAVLCQFRIHDWEKIKKLKEKR